jgi:hypothetical protein
MIRAQDALSFDDAAERFRSEATDTFGSPRTGAGSVNTLLPQQQFYVGTGFIGGEDQGYIACP